MPLSLNEDVEIYRKYLNHIEVNGILTKTAFIIAVPPLAFYGRRIFGKFAYNFTRKNGHHRVYEASSWTVGLLAGSYYCVNTLQREKKNFYSIRNIDLISSIREDEINAQILAEHDNAEIVYKRYNKPTSSEVYDYLCALEFTEQKMNSLSTSLALFGQCSLLHFFFADSQLKFFGKESYLRKVLLKNARVSFAARFFLCWMIPFYCLRSVKQDWYWKSWYHSQDKVPPTDAEVEVLEGADLTKFSTENNLFFENGRPITSMKDALEKGKDVHFVKISDASIEVDGKKYEPLAKREVVPEDNQYLTWKELVDKRNISS